MTGEKISLYTWFWENNEKVQSSAAPPADATSSLSGLLGDHSHFPFQGPRHIAWIVAWVDIGFLYNCLLSVLSIDRVRCAGGVGLIAYFSSIAIR